jgi:ABC-type sugar transport system substrate-binding protein
MSEPRTVFVVLLGRKEEGNHFQLLQEESAVSAGQRLGLRTEVVYAPAFDQVRVTKRRLGEPQRVDAVVIEPSSLSTIDVLLRELQGRTGLVLVNAWGPSVEEASRSWGPEHPFGTVSTDHAAIGRIQAAQVRRLAAAGTVLTVTGPRRSSAAQERLAAFLEAAGPALEVVDAEAGEWTEAAGATAFSDWHRIFKARKVAVTAVAAQNDELAIGVRSAIRGLAEADQRSALGAARLFGVDACPGYGRRLVDEGALAASVVTPANTALALEQLSAFWSAGRPLPLRSFTEPSPYPATSI